MKKIPEELRASLAGRLLKLKHESIGQALRRLCARRGPKPDTVQCVDRAYTIHSQLIHRSVAADRDSDLEHESRVISTN